jgi:HipA-like protein
MKKYVKEWMKQAWQAWGGLEDVHTGLSRASTREIHVLMPVAGDRKLHIGTLSYEDGEYVFAYSLEFKDQTEIPPISAFPDVGEPYRCEELWPFFRVRLPPTSREDVKQVIAERGLDEHDVIQLLGVIGRRSITTPYELELATA